MLLYQVCSSLFRTFAGITIPSLLQCLLFFSMLLY